MKPARLVVPLVTLGLLGGCGQQDAPEAVSTVASEHAAAPAAPAAPQGPAPVPAMTLQMDYLVPEPYNFAADAEAAGRCALDAMNGARMSEGTTGTGSNVLFGGWAGDAANQVPASALFVLRGDAASFAVPLTLGGERGDVARALGSETLATSGFNLPVRLEGVAPGRYSLVVVLDRTASAFCDLQKSLVVE